MTGCNAWKLPGVAVVTARLEENLMTQQKLQWRQENV